MADIKKILVVTPIRGGSRAVSQDIIAAFRDLNKEVDEIDSGSYFRSNPLQAKPEDFTYAIERTNEDLVIAARAKRPDLLLIPALAPVRRSYLQECSALGCAIAVWWVEDFRLFDHWWKDIIDLADFFFTIQPDEFHTLLGRHGYKAHFVPTGFNPRVFYADDASKQHGLSFVGSPYKNRIGIFETLAVSGLPLKIWGPDWEKIGHPRILSLLQNPKGWLALEQCAQIYRSSQIALNLHSSPYREAGIHLAGDFVNPFLFSIPACGALQIVDRRTLVSRFFDEDKEVICYSSVEELLDKCRYYLANSEVAASIARAGLERTRLENTYHHRAASMLDIVEGNNSDAALASSAVLKQPAMGATDNLPVPPAQSNLKNPIHEQILKAVISLKDRSVETDDIFSNRMFWDKKIEHHFSWKRHLLLRCLDLKRMDSAIEAHASSGAITRYLGETFRQVLSFEPNPELAQATRLRCSDLAGVTVLQENLEQWKSDRKFDLGFFDVDLEAYALNGKTRAHLQGMIETVRKALSPTGILVLALENRKGLQYVASGDSKYSTIPDYTDSSQAPCMTKENLKSLMQQLNLPAYHVIYVYPHHRLPSVFLTSEAADRKSLSLARWAGREGFWIGKDQSTTESETGRLAGTLAENRLLGELANSFLVVAAEKREYLPVIPWQLLSYTGDRRPSFARTRTYIKAGDSALTVHKEGTFRRGDFFAFEPNMRGPLFEGSSVSAQLVARIMSSDIAGFYDLLNRTMAFLVKEFRADISGRIPSPTCPEEVFLQGKMLDSIPRNIICEGAQYRLFDLEWQCNHPIPLSYWLFRSLIYLPEVAPVDRIVSALRIMDNGAVRTYDEVMLRIMNSTSFFKALTLRQLALFRQLEIRFFDFVSGHESARPKCLLEMYFSLLSHEDSARQKKIAEELQSKFPNEPETAALMDALSKP